MIQLTVALPLYNANNIAWLALESLCNQTNVNFDWELLICEEDNSQRITYLNEYVERLQKVRCVNIRYIPISDKIRLAKKWQIMGKIADKNSKCFLLQAGDCYSDPNRLKSSFQSLTKGFDWIDTTSGLFYSFISKQLFHYNAKSKTNLDMGFKTIYARNIPETTKERGIDGFLFDHCEAVKGSALKVFNITKLSLARLDTHGMNNISVNRENYFTTKVHIFKPTYHRLEKLALPQSIINSLKSINV